MVVVAIAVLGAMSWLPEIEFSGISLRKVDLLSQLHKSPDAEPDAEVKPVR